MKPIRRIILVILALIMIAAAGCKQPQNDPKATQNGETPTVDPDYDPDHTGSKTDREPGAQVNETSKTVEDYTLMEGTAEEFTVARYYGNNMVVPRDRKIVIWGTAPEEQNGKVVTAEFKGLKGSGEIKNGEFKFALQGTLPASKEKANIYIRGAEGVEKVIEDVLVGDIWVVSGQSNADLTFKGTVAGTDKDITALYGDYLNNASADDDIRLLQQINWSLMSKAGEERMATPQTDIARTTKWKIAEKKKVVGSSVNDSFSMLGYFFAKELYLRNPDVPIGIVMAGCGGASLSLLASKEACAKFPESLRYDSMMLGTYRIPASGIYNAFLAPILNVGITGMIFYQGEANGNNSSDYCYALKTMIEDYREKFGSDLLFLNVQLTSYGYESGGTELVGVWDYVPDMRFAEAEVKIDGSISNYEVIPSIDVGWKEGDKDGAHPYYKFELGQRGAQMAAALVYGIGTMEDAGFPIPSKVSYNDSEVVIKYNYAGGGLKTTDGKDVQGFQVKLDGKWQDVSATIDGNKVVIQATNAQGVRYASELRYFNLDNANLCSGTGNIAVPFCTEFK